MTRIEQFGWRGPVEPGIGRIVSAHGDYYHLVADERPEGEFLARKKKSAFRASPHAPSAAILSPCVGDFVRFRYNARGDSLITGILPRFSHFERKDPTARRSTQTLAVNFDTLFIMMSLNEDFSVPRIRRYLELAADMGRAEAVVVVTKADLRQPGDEAYLADLAAATDGVARVLMISARSGEGIDGVNGYVRPGRTVAFVGSSGVGKSTLVNLLAGEDWQATQDVQEWSGRGRHTTTSRELIMLPSGAMVVDTPGIREIGLPGEREERLVKGESTHRYRKC